MTDLLSRLEAASEGSHELSHEIYRAYVWKPGLTSDSEYTLPYTTSLDAARTLVPEGLPVLLDARPNHKSSVIIGQWFDDWPRYPLEDIEWASTPALALCIAALRARG